MTTQPIETRETRTAKKSGVPPVILAMSATLQLKLTLRRAFDFARRMGAPLMITVCLPQERHATMLFPRRPPVEAVTGIDQEAALHRRVWRWCIASLHQLIDPDTVLVRRGDVPVCAAHAAHELKAQLIVISESDIEHGGDATYIVEHAGVPVMISRIKRSSNAVIAATDMTAEGFPVVQKSADFARMLEAPLTVVHNVEPYVPLPVALAMASDSNIFYASLSEGERKKLFAHRKSSLDALAAEIGSAKVELTREVDTIGAVLDLANNEQADMVVVGHRRRSWIGRALNEAVAPRVIERSNRSIVVVPLDSQPS